MNPSRKTIRVSCFGMLAVWFSMFFAPKEYGNASEGVAGADFERVIELCREYLSSKDDERRENIRLILDSYRGEFDTVVKRLQARNYRPIKPGYYADVKFTADSLREKYPNDLLYFIVPKEYESNRATGLIVFLHGGGLNTTRDAPKYTMWMPTSDDDSQNRSSEMLASTGMITVGPSAPGKGQTSYRWCIRSSEQYLVDVIEFCKSYFNIDSDRVFLLGHSMGGFGAYHHALRQPDRFASIIVSSGSWDRGFWPVIRGTQMCIVHGVNDARRGIRGHHTDIQHARLTHRILHREGLDHKYYEHNGEHGFSENRREIGNYFARSQELKRDPYFPHIALATPQGFSHRFCSPVRHNRWLTLHEVVDGELKFDELVPVGKDFDSWRLDHRQTRYDGSYIEAKILGDNQIAVTTQHVASFTVWLHPKMVDFAKPVLITVNEKQHYRGNLVPKLSTMLESFERRRDWGLVYYARVKIDVQR